MAVQPTPTAPYAGGTYPSQICWYSFGCRLGHICSPSKIAKSGLTQPFFTELLRSYSLKGCLCAALVSSSKGLQTVFATIRFLILSYMPHQKFRGQHWRLHGTQWNTDIVLLRNKSWFTLLVSLQCLNLQHRLYKQDFNENG